MKLQCKRLVVATLVACAVVSLSACSTHSSAASVELSSLWQALAHGYRVFASLVACLFAPSRVQGSSGGAWCDPDVLSALSALICGAGESAS